MNDSVPDATVCQWPNVVKVGYYCTGVYIGKGLVLTAAHCLEGSNVPGGRVVFGENSHSSQAQVEIEVEEAIPHPNGSTSTNVWGEPSWNGVDLAVCILKSEWPGPVAPVMRIGCESNWLNFAFFNLDFLQHPRMRAVGMGCNEVNYNSYPPCVSDGQKRIWNTWLDRDWPQIHHNGTTQLVHHVPPWLDDHPMEEGDSGSPLFVRMPDSTWRVIGIYQGQTANSSAYWQPVPPFVDWIEEAANRSIALAPGPGFLADPDANGSWADSCNSGAGMGKFCGGGLFLPDPLTLTDAMPTPQTPLHFESWIVEGLPQPRRFAARLRVNGELLSVRWENTSPSNPLQLVANAINSHPILQKKQLFAVVEGSWMKTNGRIEFEHVDIPGGSIRRRHFFGDDSEPTGRDSDGFLTGRWYPTSGDLA